MAPTLTTKRKITSPVRDSGFSTPSLDRALTVMQCMGGQSSGLTLSEIASKLGLSVNFVYRVTQSLVAHGYVVRDDGEGDIYLPPNEMRAVLHKDRVKARIVRHDRKGRAEGRVVEIVERPPQPINVATGKVDPGEPLKRLFPAGAGSLKP